ncbi:chondroadherin-like [Onthophagus taurus]|uniref:chondroadherin-like n=1 Tax=Onthophagus taurus TaxID=166361 RepID=UPI0039BDBB25
MNSNKLLLCIVALSIQTYASAYAYGSLYQSSNMKCSYGERGSLTATCENATSNFFKSTPYRFDSLDETLICKNCDLGNVPSNAFDITNNQIATLILQRSNILGLSNAAFMGLIQLKVLDLSYNSIPSIAPGVFKGIKNVISLDLSHNNLGMLLKNGFSELGNLTTMHLNDNLIKSIDSGSFEKLGHLKHLDLTNNYVKEITDSFVGVPNLEHLMLRNNSLTALQPDQINMTSLISLDLSQNKIQNLTAYVFSSLKNLEQLNLSRNGLENIENGAFKGLSKLEYLDLENNNIHTLQYATFIRLHNLRELHMPYNKLYVLKLGLFSPMPELRYLNVSHNNIHGIAKGNVMKLYHLHTLDISYNDITELDYKDLFDHAQRLVYITVDNNNLPCYVVEEMIDYFNDDGVMFSIDDTSSLKQSCNKTLTKDISLEKEMVKIEKLAMPEPPQTSGNIYVIYVLLCLLTIIVCFMGYIQLKIYKETIGRKTNDIAEVNLISSGGHANHDDY